LVVFVHGLTIPTEVYLSLGISKYYTDAGYRFLTFDLYGRGYSIAPDTKHNPGLFVGQLAELLFALGINDKFHLIGLSMGGGISSYFTKVYPDRVKSLSLVSSIGIGANRTEVLYILKIPTFGELIYKNVAKKALIAAFPKEWTKKDSEDYLNSYEIVKKHIGENDGLFRSLYSTLKYFPLVNIINTIDEVNKLNKKILIIHGDKDGTVPYSSSETIHKILKGSEFVTFHGGAHNIFVEEKDDVHNRILSFIKSV